MYGGETGVSPWKSCSATTLSPLSARSKREEAAAGTRIGSGSGKRRGGTGAWLDSGSTGSASAVAKKVLRTRHPVKAPRK
jgi:hypothetical protein